MSSAKPNPLAIPPELDAENLDEDVLRHIVGIVLVIIEEPHQKPMDLIAVTLVELLKDWFASYGRVSCQEFC